MNSTNGFRKVTVLDAPNCCILLKRIILDQLKVSLKPGELFRILLGELIGVSKVEQFSQTVIDKFLSLQGDRILLIDSDATTIAKYFKNINGESVDVPLFCAYMESSTHYKTVLKFRDYLSRLISSNANEFCNHFVSKIVDYLHNNIRRSEKFTTTDTIVQVSRDLGIPLLDHTLLRHSSDTVSALSVYELLKESVVVKYNLSAVDFIHLVVNLSEDLVSEKDPSLQGYMTDALIRNSTNQTPLSLDSYRSLSTMQLNSFRHTQDSLLNSRFVNADPQSTSSLVSATTATTTESIVPSFKSLVGHVSTLSGVVNRLETNASTASRVAGNSETDLMHSQKEFAPSTIASPVPLLQTPPQRSGSYGETPKPSVVEEPPAATPSSTVSVVPVSTGTTFTNSSFADDQLVPPMRPLQYVSSEFSKVEKLPAPVMESTPSQASTTAPSAPVLHKEPFSLPEKAEKASRRALEELAAQTQTFIILASITDLDASLPAGTLSLRASLEYTLGSPGSSSDIRGLRRFRRERLREAEALLALAAAGARSASTSQPSSVHETSLGALGSSVVVPISSMRRNVRTGALQLPKTSKPVPRKLLNALRVNMSGAAATSKPNALSQQSTETTVLGTAVLAPLVLVPPAASPPAAGDLAVSAARALEGALKVPVSAPLAAAVLQARVRLRLFLVVQRPSLEQRLPGGEAGSAQAPRDCEEEELGVVELPLMDVLLAKTGAPVQIQLFSRRSDKRSVRDRAQSLEFSLNGTFTAPDAGETDSSEDSEDNGTAFDKVYRGTVCLSIVAAELKQLLALETGVTAPAQDAEKTEKIEEIPPSQEFKQESEHVVLPPLDPSSTLILQTEGQEQLALGLAGDAKALQQLQTAVKSMGHQNSPPLVAQRRLSARARALLRRLQARILRDRQGFLERCVALDSAGTGLLPLGTLVSLLEGTVGALLKDDRDLLARLSVLLEGQLVLVNPDPHTFFGNYAFYKKRQEEGKENNVVLKGNGTLPAVDPQFSALQALHADYLLLNELLVLYAGREDAENPDSASKTVAEFPQETVEEIDQETEEGEAAALMRAGVRARLRLKCATKSIAARPNASSNSSTGAEVEKYPRVPFSTFARATLRACATVVMASARAALELALRRGELGVHSTSIMARWPGSGATDLSSDFPKNSSDSPLLFTAPCAFLGEALALSGVLVGTLDLYLTCRQSGCVVGFEKLWPKFVSPPPFDFESSSNSSFSSSPPLQSQEELQFSRDMMKDLSSAQFLLGLQGERNMGPSRELDEAESTMDLLRLTPASARKYADYRTARVRSALLNVRQVTSSLTSLAHARALLQRRNRRAQLALQRLIRRRAALSPQETLLRDALRGSHWSRAALPLQQVFLPQSLEPKAAEALKRRGDIFLPLTVVLSALQRRLGLQVLPDAALHLFWRAGVDLREQSIDLSENGNGSDPPRTIEALLESDGARGSFARLFRLEDPVLAPHASPLDIDRICNAGAMVSLRLVAKHYLDLSDAEYTALLASIKAQLGDIARLGDREAKNLPQTSKNTSFSSKAQSSLDSFYDKFSSDLTRLCTLGEMNRTRTLETTLGMSSDALQRMPARLFQRVLLDNLSIGAVDAMLLARRFRTNSELEDAVNNVLFAETAAGQQKSKKISPDGFPVRAESFQHLLQALSQTASLLPRQPLEEDTVRELQTLGLTSLAGTELVGGSSNVNTLLGEKELDAATVHELLKWAPPAAANAINETLRMRGVSLSNTFKTQLKDRFSLVSAAAAGGSGKLSLGYPDTLTSANVLRNDATIKQANFLGENNGVLEYQDELSYPFGAGDAVRQRKPLGSAGEQRGDSSKTVYADSDLKFSEIIAPGGILLKGSKQEEAMNLPPVPLTLSFNGSLPPLSADATYDAKHLELFRTTGRFSCNVCYYDLSKPFSRTCDACGAGNPLHHLCYANDKDLSRPEEKNSLKLHAEQEVVCPVCLFPQRENVLAHHVSTASSAPIQGNTFFESLRRGADKADKDYSGAFRLRCTVCDAEFNAAAVRTPMDLLNVRDPVSETPRALESEQHSREDLGISHNQENVPLQSNYGNKQGYTQPPPQTQPQLLTRRSISQDSTSVSSQPQKSGQGQGAPINISSEFNAFSTPNAPSHLSTPSHPVYNTYNSYIQPMVVPGAWNTRGLSNFYSTSSNTGPMTNNYTLGGGNGFGVGFSGPTGVSSTVLTVAPVPQAGAQNSNYSAVGITANTNGAVSLNGVDFTTLNTSTTSAPLNISALQHSQPNPYPNYNQGSQNYNTVRASQGPFVLAPNMTGGPGWSQFQNRNSYVR